MVGVVVYLKSNRKACSDFGESFRSKPGGFPTFVLVDRGDCFFTTKAWNAQNAGAVTILVADDKEEPLITMDTPEEDNGRADQLQNITIPSALVSKSFGDNLRKTLEDGNMVNVNLDWRESLPHPDERVEYEFWTNSNDECDPKCDSQIEFVKDFKGVAQVLEQKGYTQFTLVILLGIVLKPFFRASSASHNASTMGDIVPRILNRNSPKGMMVKMSWSKTCVRFACIKSLMKVENHGSGGIMLPTFQLDAP